MKKKIFTLFLLLALVFAVGCNKKDKAPEPTVAPTATPVPANLAKENLEKLVSGYDKLLKMHPNAQLDYSKGIGYDLTMDFSLGQEIKDLLGITDLDTLRLSGIVDIKDAISMDLGIYLNSSELLNAVMMMDNSNVIFIFPKYSSSYAAFSMEEVLAEAGVSDSLNIAETMNPANAMQLSTELTDMFRTYMTKLTGCFKDEGITPKSSIGTGDYVMTGDKHTVKANPTDVLAVLKAFVADLEKYYGELDFDWSELEASPATALFLDYYTDEKGNFAWAFRTDEKPNDQIVFISTNLGFCLYNTEGGVETLGMTSIKSTENSGVIYLFFNEEELAEGELAEPMGTIDYEYSGKAAHADIVLDTIEATVDYSVTNDIINYDVTLVMDGLSFVLEEKASKEHVEMSLTLASYGISYATANVNITLRDYVETSAPANTVDVETWLSEADLDAMTKDLEQLLTDYPILGALLGISSENFEEEDRSEGTGSFELSADYTDDFMGMTGWNVDSEGYVDFEPLEDEVFAAGKPSTGYDLLPVSEDQTQKLFSVAKDAVKDAEEYSSTYYWVWGSTEYQDVESYYSVSYEFSNPENWDDYITLAFDPVSGDFIGVDIYNPSKEEALRIANEMFKILGGTYTITDTLAEASTYDGDAGFSFYGYDASEFGENYYNISINVYNDNWN